MAKKKSFLLTDWDKLRKQRRGLGRGENYTPRILIRDVSSHAQRQRVFLLRFNRVFHMLSHGETLTLLQLDWNDDVVEIREQYFLEPELTIKIALGQKIKHPGYTQGFTIMSTDFLVTYKKDNSNILKAYQIKYSQTDLDNPRTLEKLRIESEYWHRKKVPWCVVLSQDYNPILCDNLTLLKPYRNTPYHIQDLQFLLDVLSPVIQGIGRLPYSELEGQTPTLPILNLPLSYHDGIKILLSKKLLRFDIESKRLEDCRLNDFLRSRACY